MQDLVKDIQKENIPLLPEKKGPIDKEIIKLKNFGDNPDSITDNLVGMICKSCKEVYLVPKSLIRQYVDDYLDEHRNNGNGMHPEAMIYCLVPNEHYLKVAENEEHQLIPTG